MLYCSQWASFQRSVHILGLLTAVLGNGPLRESVFLFSLFQARYKESTWPFFCRILLFFHVKQYNVRPVIIQGSELLFLGLFIQ